MTVFRAEKKEVRVIVTSYFPATDTLIENMKSQMRNIDNVTVLKIRELCDDLGLKYDWKHPQELLKKMMRSLNTSSEHTILVVDEVFACSEESSADWSDFRCEEKNVTLILALRPAIVNADIINFTPPADPAIISRKLLYSHRNSYQIRSVSVELV